MMKQQDKEVIKNTLKSSSFGIGYAIIIYALVLLGVPILFILTLGAGLVFYTGYKNNHPPLSCLCQSLVLFLVVLTIIWLYHLLGGLGLWALVIIVALLSGYVLFRNRKQYMSWVYYIEERFLYGKRLGGKKK